jgi:hypothetical protein
VITTKDGTLIHFKHRAWGQPVAFSHWWPLTADAWENQMPDVRRPRACVAEGTPTKDLSDKRSRSRFSSVAICACSIKAEGQGLTVRAL